MKLGFWKIGGIDELRIFSNELGRNFELRLDSCKWPMFMIIWYIKIGLKDFIFEWVVLLWKVSKMVVFIKWYELSVNLWFLEIGLRYSYA